MHVRRFRTMWPMVAAVCLAAAGCGGGDKTSAVGYNTRMVTFPNGTKIRAELAIQPPDVMRGMKFRDALPEDEGMLFVHQKEGKYPYWMYEVKVPLDMIWMDRQHTVVQLVHKVPPCPGPQEKCMSYGGGFNAAYVLEVAAGVAAKNNIKPGMTLDF
ncbi:MAG: DUF192 domain-containing protein [Paludibaculum sp.]